MKQTTSEMLSRLSDQDAYAVICSFLYDLSNEPQYSLLSELCYILDKESLKRLLKYFAGRTIKIPTCDEVSEAVQIIMLFQLHEIEHKPWKEALEAVGFSTSEGKKAHSKLDKFKDIIEKYNFGNREY